MLSFHFHLIPGTVMDLSTFCISFRHCPLTLPASSARVGFPHAAPEGFTDSKKVLVTFCYCQVAVFFQDRITDERALKLRSKTEVFTPSKLARCQLLLHHPSSRFIFIIRNSFALFWIGMFMSCKKLAGRIHWKGCC